MILSLCKTFSRENAQTTCKSVEKKKKHVSGFSSLSVDVMKLKRKHRSVLLGPFCWYKNIQQYSKHNNIYTTGQKVCNFIQKKLPHRCFSMKFPKFLRTLFLMGHLQWLLQTYDKFFLVLVIVTFVKKQSNRVKA